MEGCHNISHVFIFRPLLLMEQSLARAQDLPAWTMKMSRTLPVFMWCQILCSNLLNYSQNPLPLACPSGIVLGLPGAALQAGTQHHHKEQETILRWIGTRELH